MPNSTMRFRLDPGGTLYEVYSPTAPEKLLLSFWITHEGARIDRLRRVKIYGE